MNVGQKSSTRIHHSRVPQSSTPVTITPRPLFLVRGKTVIGEGSTINTSPASFHGKSKMSSHKLTFSPRNIFGVPIVTYHNELTYEWKTLRQKTWPVVLHNVSSGHDATRSNKAQIARSYTFTDNFLECKNLRKPSAEYKFTSAAVNAPATDSGTKLTKLQCYEWTPSANFLKTSSAPDNVYRNTYGLKNEPKVSPRICGCRPLKKPEVVENQSKGQSFPTKRKTLTLPYISKQQIHERSRSFSRKVDTMPALTVRFSSKTGNPVSSEKDDDAAGLSRVNVSIAVTAETQDTSKRSLSRPLKQERGKYRPLSRTVVRTPQREDTPVTEGKDPKSSENYRKYFLSRSRRTETRGNTTGAYLAPPNTTFDKYDCAGSTNTDTASESTARMIESVMECNHPTTEAKDNDEAADRTEYLEEEEIPEWAVRATQSPTDSLVKGEPEERNCLQVNLPKIDSLSPREESYKS